MGRNIFVSYARGERDLVGQLVQHLERAGHRAFFDGELAGGQTWWDELMSQIEEAEIFMPVLSSRYVKSVPCRLEAEYAGQIRKVFLPVAIERLAPQLLSERIAAAQWISYDTGTLEAVLDLMKGINSVGDCPALPETMPGRPMLPLSSLHGIHDLIMSADVLTKEQQVVILADLKSKVVAHDDESGRRSSLRPPGSTIVTRPSPRASRSTIRPPIGSPEPTSRSGNSGLQ